MLPPSARTISWQVPPAASICSRALALTPWAWTVSGLEIDPLASTSTATPLRVAVPLACAAGGRLEVVQADALLGVSRPRTPPRDGAPCESFRVPAGSQAAARNG